MPSSVEQKIALARQKMMSEMPDVADKTNIGPMNWLEKAIVPSNAVAVTSPWTGGISYNPSMMEGRAQNDIDSDLAHELTHTRQIKSQSIPQRFLSGLKNAFSPSSDYNWRPNELEAFQTEKDRALKLGLSQEGDIQLQGLRKAR